jgi:hypothetical protein
VNATVEQKLRVWLLPHAYWEATKGMPADEVDALMPEVERLAAAKEFEALREYSFIYLGETCHRRAKELEPGARISGE